MRFRPKSEWKRRDTQPFFHDAFSPPLHSSLPTARISLYSFAVLRSLRLMDFRCFESLDLEVPAEGAILTGDNAQGKTSILEALVRAGPPALAAHPPDGHARRASAARDSASPAIRGAAERQVRYSREGLVLEGG